MLGECTSDTSRLRARFSLNRDIAALEGDIRGYKVLNCGINKQIMFALIRYEPI